jgi:hypothetical protein
LYMDQGGRRGKARGFPIQMRAESEAARAPVYTVRLHRAKDDIGKRIHIWRRCLFTAFIANLLSFVATTTNRWRDLLHVPGENFFRTAVGASQLVKDGEVAGKVLDSYGVVNSVISRCCKTQRAKYRVQCVLNFAADEEEQAAVGGAEGSPSDFKCECSPNSRCVT